MISDYRDWLKERQYKRATVERTQPAPGDLVVDDKNKPARLVREEQPGA